MKFTKMNLTGQLNDKDSAQFARRIGVSYVIAALGGAIAAVLAALSLWR